MTIRKLRTARIDLFLVGAEICTPCEPAALTVKSMGLNYGLLRGGPIDAVDLHKMVVHQLYVQPTLRRLAARPPDVDDGVTEAAHRLYSDQRSHGCGIVVLPLLMALKPCRFGATDLTSTSSTIKGRFANLVPLSFGE